MGSQSFNPTPKGCLTLCVGLFFLFIWPIGTAIGAVLIIFALLSSPSKKTNSRSSEISQQKAINIQNLQDRDTTDRLNNDDRVYDKSVFVHPETGKFRFPKYKQDPKFLVQIKDTTPYKEDLWDHLDASEKREYTFKEFEHELKGGICLEFEVTDFSTFFKKLSKDRLKQQGYLAKKTDVIEAMIEALDPDCDEIALSENDTTEDALLKDGLVCKKPISYTTPRDKVAALNSLKKTDLVPFCVDLGVNPKLLKKDMIEALLEAGIEMPEEHYLVLTEKGKSFLSALGDSYLSEAEKNAQRFHPYYMHDILDAISDQDEFAFLDPKIETIKAQNTWGSNAPVFQVETG